MDLKEMQEKAVIRLVDDDKDFLRSLELMLRLKGWQCRSYSKAEDFLSDEKFRLPGCMILDLRMPGMTGLELQNRIEAQDAEFLPVIFLSGHGDIETAVHTLKHGAMDFLEKPADPKKLFELLERAVRYSLETKSKVKETAPLKKSFESLTDREKEVFLAASKGDANKDIAENLGIGIRTVKMHRANAFEKMGIHSPVEAANLVRKLNIDV